MEQTQHMPESSERVAELISAAFSRRKFLDVGTDSLELSYAEKQSVFLLKGLQWEQVSVDFWETHADVLSWLDPASFCYYLPSVLVASVLEGDLSLSGVHSLIIQLDRSQDQSLWSNHFYARWSLLSGDELIAVRAWIEWITAQKKVPFDDTSLIRALLTIDSLVENSTKG